MVIEIGDEHAAAVFGAKGTRRDGDIVEETESHTGVRLGVVPRRTDQREDRLAFGRAGARGFDRSTRGAQRRGYGARVDEGITGR